jgi:hypothetical protein
MLDKKNHLDTNQGEDSRSSGFVVDLRQKINQKIDKNILVIEKSADLARLKLEKKERKVKDQLAKKVRAEISQLEKKAKKIKPNLLKIDKKIRVTQPFPFKKKSFWEKNYRAQVRNFKKFSRIRIGSSKNIFGFRKKSKKIDAEYVWYESILPFIFILIIIIIPLQLLSYFEFFDFNKLETKILGSSQSALNNLLAATDAASKMDLKSADSQFQNAGNNFLVAQEELNKINDSLLSLAALSNNPKLKLAAESKKFVQSGTIASSLGRNLVLATNSLFSGDKEKFSAALDQFTYYGGLAVVNATDLKNELNKINSKNLPAQYQDEFITIRNQTNSLAANLAAFVSAGAEFKDVLGATQDKRYLLVFQNNSELRASGGFLGSYALVDIRDGKIHNLEVPGGGSYDTEGGMNVRIVAPKPLWLVNPLWHFWDANWWPDWPTTAKNLMWFYEKSDGPTVDGVISLTPTVIERLLEITGPIDLTKEYGLTIDSNNFWETTQKVVEQKNLSKTNPEAIIGIPATSTVLESTLPLKQGLAVNGDNKPKKIIGDLMAKILEILPQKLNKDNLVKILGLFENSLDEKQILFYFTDENSQAEVAKRNWAGEIKNTDRDYLLVVNTNIAGQKSDREINEKIEQLSEVALDGSIIDTVKITRTHTGIKNEAMTGVRNVDWLRVYVSAGSELISADGFKSPDAKYLLQTPDVSWAENDKIKKENDAPVDASSGTKIYEENNKTVFANWTMVDPGDSAVITIKYRLAFNFLDKVPVKNWLTKLNAFLNPQQSVLIPYSLMVQKQPGAKASEFSSQLILPAAWSVFWRYPENLSGQNGWQINDSLDADKYWSILIDKK